MIDYLEYNLRKLMVDNTTYCAQKCNLFEDVKKIDQPILALKEERKLFSCFEKCLGKFSDSYDNALDVFGNHLKSINNKQVFNHSQNKPEDGIPDDKRFLLGQGVMDPIYDQPV